MAMKTFIKVTEIWIPDRSRTQLEFGSGLYGALDDFKAASKQQLFAYNEGLPGKAWALKHPVVLKQFEHSYFKRTAAAQAAGLTCGVAIPIFSGDFLLAVVVFLCGDDAEHAGALEVWCNSLDKQRLNIMDGYYGTLREFEKASQKISFAKGEGIPGQVWESNMPVLIDDISKVTGFVRAADAQQAGISTSIGIPIFSNTKETYVMAFLSAQATPIAKRIQIWIPDKYGEKLVCQQGYSKDDNNLATIFETITIYKGEGLLGRVWLTGMPMISGANAVGYSPELNNLSSMLAIPVISEGRLTAIVSFLF